MKITELLQQLKIDYAEYGQHHHVTEGFLGIDCVYCSVESKTYKLGINLRSLYATCWTCGSHSLVDALAKAGGVRHKVVQELLNNVPHLVIEREHTGKLVLPKARDELLQPHRDYLRERGFNPKKIVKLWHVEGIGPTTDFRWRIFIPFHHKGEIVSWLTRSISDDVRLRYKSATKEQEKVPHRTLLYGEDYCGQTIIVVEGPLDVWTIGPGCVATCGVGYSRAQLLRISKYPRRVILFDNEPEAQRRARKLCRDLAVFDGETYNVVLNTGKDASRASKSEVREIKKRFL